MGEKRAPRKEAGGLRWRRPSKDPADYARPSGGGLRKPREYRIVGFLSLMAALILNLVGVGPALPLIGVGLLCVVLSFLSKR